MLTPTAVMYRTTEDFGLVDADVVINALLIVQEGERGLLYHPRVGQECPSFELAQRGADGVWTAMGRESYINIDSRPRKFEKDFLGELTWKREVYNLPAPKKHRKKK